MSNMTASFTLLFKDSFSDTINTSLRRIGQLGNGISASFETSMTSVKSSILKSLSISKKIESQYTMMAKAAQRWARAQAESANTYITLSRKMRNAGPSTQAALQGQGPAPAQALTSTISDTYKEKIQANMNALNLFNEQLGNGSNFVRMWSTNILGGLASLVLFNNENEKGTQVLMGVLGGTLEVSKGLLEFAGSANSTYKTIKDFSTNLKETKILTYIGNALHWVSKGLLGIGRAIVQALPQMVVWIGSVWSAAAAHLAVYWPIYAIIGGLALLGTGIVLLIKHWDTVKTAIRGGLLFAFDALKKSVFWVWDIFKKLSDNPIIASAATIFAPLVTIPSLIFKHWEPIKDFFDNLFGTVGRVIDKVGSFLGLGKGPKIRVDGTRALGGPVLSGATYLVGERGPELFSPSQNGRIIPNKATGQFAGQANSSGANSSSNTQYVINIDKVVLPKPNDLEEFVHLITMFGAEVVSG